MSIPPPLFALSGRGNDVRRARDLIASIGGIITKKEQEADYLVVMKGAGRRRVENYLHHHSGTHSGPNVAAITQPQKSGRLLLLDSLEEWSRQGRPPPRHISMQEIDEINLFGIAHDCGRDSCVATKDFLRSSFVNDDNASSRCNFNCSYGDHLQLTTLPASSRKTLSTSPSLLPTTPQLTTSAALPVTDDVVFMTRRQLCGKRCKLLVDDEEDLLDTRKTGSAKGVEFCELKDAGNLAVVNPMRAAFYKRPKPDWDTYFADVSQNNDAVDRGKFSHTGRQKKTNAAEGSTGSRGVLTNSQRSSYCGDLCGKGAETILAESSSKRISTNYIRPLDDVRDDTVLRTIGATKSGIAPGFGFLRKGCRKDGAFLDSVTRSQRKNVEEKKNIDGERKKTDILEGQQRPKHDNKRQRLDNAVASAVSNVVNRRSQSSVDNSCTPRLFKPSSHMAPRKKTSNGVSTNDKTLETSSSASSFLVNGACGSRNPNGPKRVAATPTRATLPAGRKSAAAAVKKNPNNSIARATHSNSLLSRVRQSPYCEGIPEEVCAMVLQQIVDSACPVSFNSIAGLEVCKRILHEAIILPAKCPQLFTGLRKPCSGLLLFGPPGNGKTLLASAVARECDTTFFSISAAAIMSKWVGESERMVRALFAVARALAPSTIFVDEIDALLQARGGQHEGEGSRRVKTEFLVQMDGARNDSSEAHVLVMGATNRPFDLDEAIIRRFPKRVFVPLPDAPAREQILQSLLNTDETPNTFTTDEWRRLVALTENYSGHDLRQLCEEAAMIPVRELLDEKLRNGEDIAAQTYNSDLLRPLRLRDVELCVKSRHPSCCLKQLKALSDWSDTYGSR